MKEENKKNDTNNRLVYQEGDIEFGNTQCELCKYNDSANNCIKYSNGKPNEIITGKQFCKFLELNGNKIDDIISFEKAKQIVTEEEKTIEEIDEKVQEFARNQGYQKADYLNEWNGYNCYEPISNESTPSFTGLPLLILVDSNNNIRLSISEEAFRQIRETKKNENN